MKNKIIASLLAVALFVGMAVPAFADYSSGADGDYTKATFVDFMENGEVITTKSIQQDAAATDISALVRVYESKDQLILSKENLSYELDGNQLIFSLDPNTANVTAIEKSGSANIIVKNSSTDKVLGKLKLVATPKAADKKNASGYAFKSLSNNTIISGAASPNAAPTGTDGSKVTVVATPAGTVFTSGQEIEIKANVAAALRDVLTWHTFADSDATGILGGSTGSLIVTGLPQGKHISLTFKEAAVKLDTTTAIPVGKVAIEKDKTSTPTLLKIVATANVDTSNSAKISLPGIIDIANNEYRNINIRYVVAGDEKNQFVFTDATTKAAVTYNTNVASAGTITHGVFGPGNVGQTAIVPAINTDRNEISFQFTNAKDELNPTVKLPITVTNVNFPGSNSNTRPTFDVKSYVQPVGAVEAKKIGVTPVITIEVGEELDLTKKDILYSLGTSNVGRGFTVETDLAPGMTDFADYAAVDSDNTSGKIIGVKKGASKIRVTLANGDVAEGIVKVVSKGTKKPTTPEVKPTLGWQTSAVKVGGTTVLAVKNATGTITYSSSDDKIATVDKVGKITGVKAGTVTISVKVGEETLKATVKVDAATKPDVKPTDPSKPTTNPSTGVALLGQLF